MTLDEIEEIYQDMMYRQHYEGSWIKADGGHEPTDVAYALEGAYLFLEELREHFKEE